MKTLKDVLPFDALTEFNHLDKLLNTRIVEEITTYDKRLPFSHKNIYVWWILDNNIAIGWNENPARGWAFPVKKLKNK